MSNPFIHKRIRIENRLDTLDNGKIITENKGDIIVDNGSKTTKMSVGINKQVLVVDSNEETGLKWSNLDTELINNFDDEINSNEQVSLNTSHRLSSNAHGVTGNLVGTGGNQTISNKSFIDETTKFIDNVDSTKKMKFELAEISTNNERTLTVPDANTTLVGTNVNQILSNKSFVTPHIKDLSETSSYIFEVNELSSNKNVILPALTNNDTFVFQNHNQILQNKTINAANNTITELDNSSIKSNANIDANKISNGSVSNSEFNKLSGIKSTIVGITDEQTLINKIFNDSNVYFQNDANNSKKLRFDLTNIPDSVTRIFGFPSVSTTLIGTNSTQTLTNKVIDATLNTIIKLNNTNISENAGINADKIASGVISNTEFEQLNGVTSAVVSINNIQTLQNKTLIDSNTYFADNNDSTKKFQFELQGISSGTTKIVTLPNENITIVGTNSTQTLYNKGFGDNVNMNNNKIINVGDPINDLDCVNKGYVDAIAQGLQRKESVRVKTDGPLPDYTQSGTGEGATLTANENGSLPSIDGVVLTTNDRILVDSDGSTNDSHNGIYAITQLGDLANPWILTRAIDADSDNEVKAGLSVFVNEGTIYADSGFALITDDPITVDVTGLTFTKVSGAGQIDAGTGMTKLNNTLNVNGSSTIIANADDLQVNSSNTANQVLLSTGTVGVPAEYGALTLNNSNSVSGILSIFNGGTGTSSFDSGDKLVITNSDNDALETSSIDINSVVTLTNTQTISNKTLTTPKINDLSNNNTYNIVPSELPANVVITLPVLSQNDVMVFENHSQTLFNKTLVLPKICDSSNDHAYSIKVPDLIGNVDINFPALVGNDTFVFENYEQDLYNKSLMSPKIYDADQNNTYNIVTSSLNVDHNVIFPALLNDDTFLFENHSQTLKNKSFVDTTIIFQNNTDSSKKIKFDLSDISSGTTRSYSLPNANTKLIGIDTNQELTNKTINVENNSVSNITNTNIKVGAAINAQKIADGSVTNTSFQYLSGIGSTVMGINDSQVVTNKTFTDVNTFFQDNVDNTKKIQFELSTISSNTIRTITFPDDNITIVGKDITQTITNKIINANDNTLINITNSSINANAQINANKIANGSVSNLNFQRLSGLASDVVGISDIQTLTNKTLSVPKILTSINDANNNEFIKFNYINAAVNEITISNSTTNNGPSIKASGNDTNIDLNILSKGTGSIVLNNLNWPNNDGNDGQVLTTNGNGQLSFANVSIKSINETMTTANNPTTLINLSTNDDKVYLLEANIIARRTDAQEEGAGYVIRGFFRNDSGVLTKLGESIIYSSDSEWTITISSSGTDIIIQVIGEVGKTINWKATSNLISV